MLFRLTNVESVLRFQGSHLSTQLLVLLGQLVVARLSHDEPSSSC